MTVVKREDLYALVWSESATKAAERYGISSVALAKAARKAGIPMPPRGYWEQVRFGKKPKRAALPKIALGQDALIRFRDRPIKPNVGPEMIADDVAAEIEAIRQGKPLAVRERVVNAHRLLGRYHSPGTRTAP
jgi:hypothetical protein